VSETDKYFMRYGFGVGIKKPSETDQRVFLRGRGRKNEVLFFIRNSYYNIRASF